MENKTKVWAHRGASGEAPENTLEAFELALKQGADGLELDVHISKDGHLIVMHDEQVDRTTNGTGQIRRMTLKELKALNAGTKEQPMEIPTLDEIYAWAQHNTMEINVEIKSDAVAYENIESKCLELAARYGVETVSYTHLDVYKRQDLILSLLILIVLSPVMAVTAVCIKVYDRGPVLFRQERCTIDGRIFKICKFRSMVTNAEEKGIAQLATEHDLSLIHIYLRQ